MGKGAERERDTGCSQDLGGWDPSGGGGGTQGGRAQLTQGQTQGQTPEATGGGRGGPEACGCQGYRGSVRIQDQG